MSFFRIKIQMKPCWALNVIVSRVCHHVWTNVFEAVTGRDTTLSKRQPYGLTTYSPSGSAQFTLSADWGKLGKNTIHPCQGQMWKRRLFNVEVNEGQLLSASLSGRGNVYRIMCSVTVRFYFLHLFIYGLIYVLFNI